MRPREIAFILFLLLLGGCFPVHRNFRNLLQKEASPEDETVMAMWDLKIPLNLSVRAYESLHLLTKRMLLNRP